MAKFKFLEHTADLKFQAFGKTLEEVFKNSAYAMFSSMYKGKVKKSIKVKIKVKGKDFESLLYNFLEEFLVLLDSEGFFLSEIKKMKIDIEKHELEAEAIGDDVKNYNANLNVKAITYNEMFVRKEREKWTVQAVVDV